MDTRRLVFFKVALSSIPEFHHLSGTKKLYCELINKRTFHTGIGMNGKLQELFSRIRQLEQDLLVELQKKREGIFL